MKTKSVQFLALVGFLLGSLTQVSSSPVSRPFKTATPYSIPVQQWLDINESPTPGGIVKIPAGLPHVHLLRSLESGPSFEEQVVEIVNQERWDNGELPPLKKNSLLDGVSITHSSNMATRDFFAHCDLDTGMSPFDRMTAAGYSWNYAGENIAAGYPTPASVMAGWMSSSGHRANILSSSYREIGAGYVNDSTDVGNVRRDLDSNCTADSFDNGPYFHYWTQNFGERNDVYPLFINREAYETSGLNVSLYVYGQGFAQEMRFKNETASWSAWEPYSPNKSWTLSTGNGVKQVFVEIRDGIGTILSASDTIVAKYKDTTGVFRPSNGLIYLKSTNSTGYADAELVYGSPGDLPVTGDWDGDGVDTIGIYRDGVFYLRNSNTTGYADLTFAYGVSGDLPVAGDWDGDGVDTVGIYRDGLFMLRNSNVSGAPDVMFALGVAGDEPIAGDWNNDGVDSTGVFRPTNGLIYLKNENTTGYADIEIVFGIPGDKPTAGDWDGDGIDTIGVYRDGMFLLRNTNTTGYADAQFALGVSGDLPISGKWGKLP